MLVIIVTILMEDQPIVFTNSAFKITESWLLKTVETKVVPAINPKLPKNEPPAPAKTDKIIE